MHSPEWPHLYETPSYLKALPITEAAEENTTVFLTSFTASVETFSLQNELYGSQHHNHIPINI